ncbi:MAG: hypothetical protein RI894_1897 [Bacteroidota bacterium]|jgi:hypothetical protein
MFTKKRLLFTRPINRLLALQQKALRTSIA